MPNITIPFYSGRVVVLSDLHLDKYLERGLDPFETHSFAQLWSYIDALYLAGDLTDGPQQQWRQVSKYLSRYVPTDRIFVTPGNHDHFEGSLDDDVLLADETKKAGAHFAQKSVSTTAPHGFCVVRFGVTSTLWVVRRNRWQPQNS